MNENENLKPIEKLTPFTKMIMTIGTLPSSFYASMSYYESMVWLYEYLKNEVIPAVNNNGEAVEELQAKFIELKSYIDSYFENLDVQQEINNKLDEMALDGTLTNLIKGYVDPIYQAYEEEINLNVSTFKNAVNNSLNTFQLALNNVASGSPLSASSTADMTDTSKIYVNTTNGYWYYYDGDSWEQGGEYLSTFDENKINNLVSITLTNWKDNYYLNSLGTETSNTSYAITDYIPVFNNGVHFPLLFYTKGFKNTYAGAYDLNKNLIETIKLSNSDSLEFITKKLTNENYYYIRFSCDITQKDNAYAYYTDIYNMSLSNITRDMLNNQVISKEQTNYIIDNPYHNLINLNNVTSGYYINNNGQTTATANLNVSDYFNIKEETTYLYSNIRTEYYAFYDINKEFIGGQSTYGQLSGGTFTTPENAYYMRVTIHSNNLSAAYVSLSLNPLPYDYSNVLFNNNYCNYNGKEISTFNKILCIGDSLTKGVFNTNGTPTYITEEKYSYPAHLKKLTGVDTTNAGDSGKTIETWWNAHSSDDLSGHDCCIIALGINDTEWTSSQETYLSNIINKVNHDNKNIPIFVSNIIPASAYQQSYHADVNTGITNYINGLNSNQVRLIDINKYGHTNDHACYNAGHLSAYGYHRLAQDFANYISFLMTTNPNAYKKIQFVGTDYNY